MPKKKIEDTTPVNTPSPMEETKPVKASQVSKPSMDETRPAAVKRAPKAPRVEPQAPAEVVTPAVELVNETEPVKKPKRAKWIWLGILSMLVITAIGIGIGYLMAMQARQNAEAEQRLTAANKQYALAIVDQEAGNYNSARQRYEYILQIYPEYPNIDQKLVEIGVLIAQNQGSVQVTTPQPQPTVQAVITPVPTSNTKSTSILLKQAQDQYNAGDWSGLYTTVLALRDIDPSYEPVKVDGLYYAALRNHGVAEIQSGNLESGLYAFALAEDIAPIDVDAESYRMWARMYLAAGSYWSVNWQMAVDQFASLYGMVPQLMDSSGITVTERYARALDGYGDYLQQTFDWCGAVTQYEKAQSIYSFPGLAEKLPQAREYCANPPATPTPTQDPNAPTPTPED